VDWAAVVVSRVVRRVLLLRGFFLVHQTTVGSAAGARPSSRRRLGTKPMTDIIMTLVMGVAAIFAFFGGVNLAANRGMSLWVCLITGGFLGIIALAALWTVGGSVFGK
jgi:hypothetical protein